MRFVDTNVLLYAVSTSPDEQDRAVAARGLLRSRDLVVSTQVLSEFYVQATRASRTNPMAHADAASFVESFTRFRVEPVTVAVVRRALDLRQRFALSFWDAAVVAAAQISECTTLLTEDLQHGQNLGGVVVHNPFIESIRAE